VGQARHSQFLATALGPQRFVPIVHGDCFHDIAAVVWRKFSGLDVHSRGLFGFDGCRPRGRLGALSYAHHIGHRLQTGGDTIQKNGDVGISLRLVVLFCIGLVVCV
jgi:hypothetical protein